MNAIVLDSDELRASISIDLGFSKEDRDEHNMRSRDWRKCSTIRVSML